MNAADHLIALPSHIPDSSEVQQSLFAMQDFYKKIRETNLQIDELQEVIRSHVEYRDEQFDQIILHRAFIAPVRRLPFEILGEIFGFLIETPNEDGFYPLPLGISRVSRFWNQVVMNTPRLWSRITIAPQRRGAIPLLKLPIWLKRAGLVPLALTINYDGIYGADVRAVTESITQLLADRSFRSIKILHGSCVLPETMVPFLQEHASQLTSFALTEDTCFHHLAPSPAAVFMTSPHLTDLDIPMTLLEPQHPVFNQIRSLKLHDHFYFQSNFPKVVETLSHCSSLTKLTITSYAISRGLTTFETICATLPSVQELTLREDIDVGLLFTHVSFPALQNLVVKDTFTVRASAFGGGLKALVNSSKPPLKALHLHNVKASETVILWTLDRLPELKTLELYINDEKIGEKTIDAFARVGTKRKRWLCPKLEFLSIRGCDRYNDWEIEVDDMARLRMDEEGMRALTTMRTNKKGKLVRTRGVLPVVPIVMGEIWVNERSYENYAL